MNYAPGVNALHGKSVEAPRHSAIVRITHWVMVLSVIGLFVSGTGIFGQHSWKAAVKKMRALAEKNDPAFADLQCERAAAPLLAM